MSKILLITNKTDITTDFIVKELKERKISFYRLNTEEIGNKVRICFDFVRDQYLIVDSIQNLVIDLLLIKSVYFRRPEVKNNFNELSKGESIFTKGEILFTLEGLYKVLNSAFWINNVFSIRNAENKIYQLLLAKELGLTIPNSIITNDNKKALSFYENNNKSCIIKPIKSGLVEGSEEEGVIFTSQIELNEVNSQRIKICPVYLQKLILKKGDIRLTVVGDKIFPAFIHSQETIESKIDWRRAGFPLKHSAIEIPIEIVDKCLRLTKKLSLSFAAIDFVLDENDNFTFLEINPNGQWAWIEKQLNFNIANEITTLLVKNRFN